MLKILTTFALMLVPSTSVFPQGLPVAINRGRPLSVCDVLKDHSKYQGQVVEVRGEWDGSLVASCPVLKTGYYEWPNAIIINFPSNGIVQLEQPAGWLVPFDVSTYNAAVSQAWSAWPSSCRKA